MDRSTASRAIADRRPLSWATTGCSAPGTGGSGWWCPRARSSPCRRPTAARISARPTARSSASSPAIRRASGVSIGREAVEQAGAAGRHQGGRIAGARGVRRVPRLRSIVVTQARAVGMAQHRVAFAALGPVAAGHVLVRREGGAIGLRAGKDVVLVYGVQPGGNQAAVFGDDGVGTDL